MADGRLVRALAIVLDAAIVPVQASRGRPIILSCRWCGKRSNPRADVDTAVKDLSDDLNSHPEYADAMLAAWIEVCSEGLSAVAFAHEVAGRSDEAAEVHAEVERIRRDARKDLLAALDELAAERGR